jgi:hypothetical protein
MRGNLRLRVRLLAAALLAAGAVFAGGLQAWASWDGTERIKLGDKAAARFEAGDASQHQFSFFAPKDTVLNVKAKVASGLTLAFDLYNDRMAKQDLGTTAGAAGIKNYLITANGNYTLFVSPASGSGSYLLTTKAKYPKKIVVDSSGDVTFGAIENAVLTAAVKPAKGSAATAVINALTCPGDSMPITPGGTSLSKVTLPENATYTLDLVVTGTGNVTTTVSIKSPVSKGTWSFGAATTPVGTVAAIKAAWLGSGHSDPAAEAFRHWDSYGVVGGSSTTTDKSCAKCHSSDGMLDWLGATGKVGDAVEVMDFTVPTGQFVDCATCHSAAMSVTTDVLFPSGKRISDLGPEARCMECHQGRESTVSVNALITASAAADDIEMPTAQNKFLNVHYFAAGATLYGREAAGAYEYAGKVYNGKFAHVEALDSCIGCHDQHSLEVKVSACSACHEGVAAKADLKNIRMIRSVYDYDGDGSVAEGIAGEIDGMAAVLLTAIKDYGVEIGFPIAYSSNYPYWANDTNANGSVDTGEGKYTHWTPRMERAAYNYQFYVKDPGAYAHNSRYLMQVLYDSAEDLATQVAVLGLAGMRRSEADFGHFDATSDAYRDWDSDYMVNTSCAQCHSSEGFKTYISNIAVSSSSSTEVSQTPASPSIEGMPCESCHEKGVFDAAGNAKLRYVPYVFFPSNRTSQVGVKKLTNGAKGTAAEDPSFICLTCHQGRNSKQTIDDYFVWNTDSTKWSFQNVHYAAAGAMLYGKDAQVGYEYSGKTYVGAWVHGSAANTRCTFCHMQPAADGKKSHAFKPDPANTACQVCHGVTTDIEQYGRIPGQFALDTTDYNGNGNATEDLKDEVQTYADAVYALIRSVSLANGAQLVFEPNSNPYWFVDVNGNGIYDAGDTSSTGKWTVALMRACHNYQFFVKETQGWAHNRKYVMELLYDSIDDLNGGVADDVPTLTRP